MRMRQKLFPVSNIAEDCEGRFARGVALGGSKAVVPVVIEVKQAHPVGSRRQKNLGRATEGFGSALAG